MTRHLTELMTKILRDRLTVHGKPALIFEEDIVHILTAAREEEKP